MSRPVDESLSKLESEPLLLLDDSDDQVYAALLDAGADDVGADDDDDDDDGDADHEEVDVVDDDGAALLVEATQVDEVVGETDGATERAPPCAHTSVPFLIPSNTSASEMGWPLRT